MAQASGSALDIAGGWAKLNLTNRRDAPLSPSCVSPLSLAGEPLFQSIAPPFPECSTDRSSPLTAAFVNVSSSGRIRFPFNGKVCRVDAETVSASVSHRCFVAAPAVAAARQVEAFRGRRAGLDAVWDRHPPRDDFDSRKPPTREVQHESRHLFYRDRSDPDPHHLS